MSLMAREYPSGIQVNSKPVVDAIRHHRNAGVKELPKSVKLKEESELSSQIISLVCGRKLDILLLMVRLLETNLIDVNQKKYVTHLLLLRFQLVM